MHRVIDIPKGATVNADVHAFGSDRFGIALIWVLMQDATAERSVCIPDKKTFQPEMTSPR